ncbi:MAG: site-specific DNA-methyltransferase [Deltaproteobacteria bacterium]|nr:site-specific DNA-methyltransferase [Deltaproteobacteria bacterium]
MANKKTKLELTWIGKENRPRLEPRILIEDPEESCHAMHRVREDDIFDNRLIFGDNLLALKALEQEFAGKVKCIYVDPPYNTGQALEHYEDGLEHSVWLNLMSERLILLQRLLSEDGVLFVQLDDTEMAYCKILLDEIFGRSCFLNQVAVRMKQTAGASGGGEDKRLKKNIEYILIYVKNNSSSSGFQKFNDVYEEVDLFDHIDQMEALGKSWKYTSILLDKGAFVEERTVYDAAGQPINVQKFRGIQRTTVAAVVRESGRNKGRESVYKESFDSIFSDTNAQSSIRTRIIDEFETLATDEMLVASYIPRSGRHKGKLVEHYYISPTVRRIIWLRDSSEKRRNKLFKKEKLGTYWSGFPLTNLTKEGGVRFPHGKKPESLVQSILELATQKGDLVLDSFAGSGTAGAVAHKMGRRWIMVELGDHCHTHIIPRIKKVIDGKDPGGITKAVNWKGGGGFRYYRLGPSLIVDDEWGNPVINPDFNAEMLAEAMCKLEGFEYAPSEEVYWIHGKSTETDFLYVTTQFMSKEMLTRLSDGVGPERTLLICCAAFRCDPGQFPNLTIKKIPKAVLKKCEWGHDDYSLEIKNLPKAPPEPDEQTKDTPAKPHRKFGKGNPAQATLFDMEGGSGDE